MATRQSVSEFISNQLANSITASSSGGGFDEESLVKVWKRIPYEPWIPFIKRKDEHVSRLYKVGDRVRLRADADDHGDVDDLANYSGCTATIIDIEENYGYPIEVRFDDGHEESFNHSQLKLINNNQGETIMANAKDVLKQAKLTETDRVLRRFDMENEDGSLTSYARDLIIEELWADKREAVAKKLVAAEKAVADAKAADEKAVSADEE